MLELASLLLGQLVRVLEQVHELSVSELGVSCTWLHLLLLIDGVIAIFVAVVSGTLLLL